MRGPPSRWAIRIVPPGLAGVSLTTFEATISAPLGSDCARAKDFPCECQECNGEDVQLLVKLGMMDRS